MIKKALTPAQTLAITAFVLSCFAVLLYLWITFGGSAPPSGMGAAERVPGVSST